MAPKITSNNSDADKKAFNSMLSQKIRDCAKDRFGETVQMKGDQLVVLPIQTTVIDWAFVEFYVREVLAVRYKFGVQEEIDAGLRCGGKDDLCIDFGYRDDSGKVPSIYICRGKYVSNGGDISWDDLQRFASIDARIRSDALATANDNVRDLFRGFKSSADFDAAQFHYFFITNGRVSKEIRKKFDEQVEVKKLRRKLRAKYGDMFLADGDKLPVEYGNAQEEMAVDLKKTGGKTQSQIVEIPVRNIGNQPGFMDLSSALGAAGKPYQTAILIVSGSDIGKLANRPSIYHSNIRGYLGTGKRINKDMADTLKKEPGVFYLRNNGMSALCSSFEFLSDRNAVRCQDFQIINGAQTASTLGRFADDLLSAKKLEKVNVLLRVTGTGADSESSDIVDFRRDIIDSNNSQNPIRLSDFRSNDKIQQFLQGEFAKLHYSGKKPGVVWYIPKRGDPQPSAVKRKSPPKPKELKMEDLAKSIFAYNFGDPAKLYSQSAFLFGAEEGGEGVYWTLFGDENGNKVSHMPPDDMRKMAAIAFLQMYLDQRLRDSRREMEKEKRSSIPYMSYCAGWHFLWAFGCALRCFYPNREGEIYEKIVNGNGLAEDGLVHQWIDKIEEIIQGVLINEASGKEFNYKRWLRSKEGVEQIGEHIKIVKRPKKDFPIL